MLSVAGVVERAQEALDDALGACWVRGEVFEYRGPHRSGHAYFKLRDEDAQIEVKLWAGVARKALRCELEEGREVLVSGHFDIWSKNGRLGFILDHVEDFGAGELARQFVLLKQRLAAEGLFSPARKRALPARPRRVLLLTAAGSAAEADVLRTWDELAAPFDVWIRPTRVQGDGAAADLAAGLAEAGHLRPDVVLLTRGGGSLEDLWAFQEEETVRAVVDCAVPVLCAVGHETDESLAELAADARAKTPTAAARELAEGWLSARGELLALGDALETAAFDHLQATRDRIDRLARDLRDQRPERRLERTRSAVNQLHGALVHAADRRLAAARRRLEGTAARLRGAAPTPRVLRGRLEGLGARLEAASPEAPLRRGYAVVEVEGRAGFLRDARTVAPGDALSIRLARGRVVARVESGEDDRATDDGASAGPAEEDRRQ